MTRDEGPTSPSGRRAAKRKRTAGVGRTGARFPSADTLDPEPHTDNPPESGDLAAAAPPDDSPPPSTADEPPPDDTVAATGARFGPYSAGKSKRAKDFDPRASDPRSTGARSTDPRLVGAPHAEPPSVVPPGEPTPEQSAERTVHIVHPWAGALVRPYAHTGGRTRASHDLALEALISSSGRAHAGGTAVLTTHHRRMIVDLCARPRSVAEVAALLSVPLGVARVLVGDLATAGAVVVHPTAGDGAPDVAFMRRVLVGLRKL
jgi:hypothetical protein